MPITRRRRGEKRNHKKSRKMRGGWDPSSFSTAKTQVQQQFGQAASAVYGRVKDVSGIAAEAIQDQATKILDELQSQATQILDELKEQVNAITEDALAELKIKASAAAKQAVAEALVAVKSQI